MTSEVTENKTSDETERNDLHENKDVGENEQTSPIKKKNNPVRIICLYLLNFLTLAIKLNDVQLL